MTAFPQITHALFDMDGLLSLVQAVRLYEGPSDSERVYTQVTNEILGRYGHQLTWEIKSGVMGRVAKEACAYVLSHYPDVPLTVDEYFEERTRIQNELWKKVPLMAGAAHLVKSLHAQGVPIALATGSSYANLLLKTGHLQDVFGLFPKDCIVCADSEQIAPGRGKPQPDIFLVAAQTLGLDVGTADECSEAQKAARGRCIVFEDAIPGVKAGVAADMNVIWVPDENLRALDPDNTYGAAQILKSLEEWKPEEWGLKPFPAPQ